MNYFHYFFQTIAGVLGWVKRWLEPNDDFSPLNINVSECQMKHPFVFPEMRIRWIFLSSSGSNIHIKCKLEEVWITLCIQIGRRRNLSWEGHPDWIQKTTNDQPTKTRKSPTTLGTLSKKKRYYLGIFPKHRTPPPPWPLKSILVLPPQKAKTSKIT